MERTHWGQHGDECFGCKLHSISFDPYAMPSRLHPEVEPRKPNPAWERGIAVDQRGMPQLRPDGSYMGLKEYSENRHRIEEHRRQMRHSASTRKD